VFSFKNPNQKRRETNKESGQVNSLLDGFSFLHTLETAAFSRFDVAQAES